MLFTAKLSKQFWAEALIAAVYLYNRTPHSALNYKTPYEVRYNKKPKITHIKIWGSIAYNKIDDFQKLDPRAKPNILIGYGNNQYKLMDLNSKRAYWSRDVVILEGVFLYNLKRSETPYTDILIDQEELDTVNINDMTRHISFRETNSDNQNTTTLSENDKDTSNSIASQYDKCDISLSED